MNTTSFAPKTSPPPQPAHAPGRLAATLTALAAAALLGACSSLPDRHLGLEQAHQRLRTAQADPSVTLHAADELRQAGLALKRADQAQAERQDRVNIDHLTYLGSQRVRIAQETAAGRAAQAVIAGAGAERDRMLLALRTQEADATRVQLASAERQGQRSAADLAQAERAAMASQAQLAQADQANRASRDQLARSENRAEDLQRQLDAMDARKTDRGIVVTLGDLLFESGEARVLASGATNIARLAEFMKRYPMRRAAIEGYTDDVGSTASNQLLSDRRAEAVMVALTGMGVGAERLTRQGHGESRPVASNATAAGRQTNRRVEVVFTPEPADILR